MGMKNLIVGVDYIGVGTCAVCHDGKGRVFLNRRGRKCRDEWGRWDNCGGRVEFGEEPEACVKRE
jgi:8-oxo-dGTP pyrophosphatase MutT (NUDIX family)